MHLVYQLSKTCYQICIYYMLGNSKISNYFRRLIQFMLRSLRSKFERYFYLLHYSWIYIKTSLNYILPNWELIIIQNCKIKKGCSIQENGIIYKMGEKSEVDCFFVLHYGKICKKTWYWKCKYRRFTFLM